MEQVEQIFNLSLAGIKAKYLSCKEQYGDQVAYFEVSDEASKQSLKRVQDKAEDGVKMPYFNSTNSDALVLRVKAKHIKGFDGTKSEYNMTVNLEGYNFNDHKVYYAKITKIRKITSRQQQNMAHAMNSLDRSFVDI